MFKKDETNDANTWFLRGLALLNLGKHEEAVKCFDEAIKINPNDANLQELQKYLKEQ